MKNTHRQAQGASERFFSEKKFSQKQQLGIAVARVRTRFSEKQQLGSPILEKQQLGSPAMARASGK
jgi:hypothetical protein